MYGFRNGNSLTALREYNHPYLDRGQPYRRVFETGTPMAHARVGRRKRDVRDYEDVFIIVLYVITHQPALASLPQVAVRRTLRENQFVLSMRNQKKGCSQG
jgi:hypothetical protein